ERGGEWVVCRCGRELARLRSEVPAFRFDVRRVFTYCKGYCEVRERAGRERETVRARVRAEVADARVGLRRERVDAGDVGAVLLWSKDELRVEAVEVVVLFQHEAVGREDLQHPVHRGTQRVVRFERGDQRLPLLQAHREAIDVTV